VLRQVDSAYVKTVWDLHHPTAWTRARRRSGRFSNCSRPGNTTASSALKGIRSGAPEIEEPEIALPQHVRVLREWMAGERDRSH